MASFPMMFAPDDKAAVAAAQKVFAKHPDADRIRMTLEGGKSLEVAASWAINQAPQQQGTICRVYGEKAAIEVYTPDGAPGSGGAGCASS